MNQWHYHSPWMFLLLLLVPAVAYFLFTARTRARLRFSYVGIAERAGRSHVAAQMSAYGGPQQVARCEMFIETKPDHDIAASS